MLISIGIYVVGLVAFLMVGFLTGLTLDLHFDIGFIFVTVVAALVGVYFIGQAIVTHFNLI